MDVQLEETGQFGRKVSVTIPAPEVDKAFNAVYKDIAKNARVPGFRPGKAPRGVLEKHYASQVQSEVRERLVGDSLYRALQDKKVSPIGAPHIHLGSLAPGGAFSYTAEFEVQPDIEVKKSKGLKVEKVVAEVTETEIDEQLETMRKQGAQLVPVLIRDTVENGDVVLVDYEGTMGGVAFQGGKAENALIEIGAEGYLKEFQDGLLGARVPGERVVQVDFPADYGVKTLAGKPATFKIKVKEIKKKELPALDDEFARDLGEETLAALKEKVRESMTEHKKRETEAQQRKKVLEALVSANPFEVPPSMVNEQAERMIAGAHARVQQMVGKKIDLGAEELQKLRDDSKTDAEFQVRSGLLLLAVAEQEKMKVDNSEIDAEIEKMAEQAGEHAARVRAAYGEPEMKNRLGYRLLEDKAINYLLSNAELT
jgi:trigger factor